MGALLHDVIEDTQVSKDALIEKFGEPVADLVDGVSKLTQIKFESHAEAQAENFRKMVLAMVEDIRVILVKLADRLHNMRTLGVLHPSKRRRIARETLEIYAPVANRLGMHSFYMELEDLGFAALCPLRSRIIEEAVSKVRGRHKSILKDINKSLSKHIKKYGIEGFDVIGRQKHLYSIYKKMRNKNLSFSEITDVYAFRIVVDSVDTAYRVLGAVHNLYKPVPEKFKDYIAIPKANGYQSLHTTLFGPSGVPIEIQIRTEEMDKLAESGIAAHWLYKAEEAADEAHIQIREWVKGLLDFQQETGSPLEFIENVKIDLFPDEVYVFTPRGKIMELPSRATPVDFAYAVHTDIGNTCVAAKVNRRLAPLSTPLVNGQTVEIITAPGARSNPAWLNFVVTGKARSNIRDSLKKQRRGESVVLGKRLLEKALSSLETPWQKLSKKNIKDVLQLFHYQSEDDLLEAIGLGNQMAVVVAHRLIHPEEDLAKSHDEHIATVIAQPLHIKGTEGMVVSFAECCQPIPGDPIVGLFSVGKGIIVHMESCQHLDKFRHHPEKYIPLQWEDEVQGDFKVDICVEVANQRGVLAKLASSVADVEANIDDIAVDQREGDFNTVNFTLSVKDRRHLARVMRQMRALKAVTRITRQKLKGP